MRARTVTTNEAAGQVSNVPPAQPTRQFETLLHGPFPTIVDKTRTTCNRPPRPSEPFKVSPWKRSTGTHSNVTRSVSEEANVSEQFVPR